MSHDVFVCHSSQDRMVANAIVARLEERGIRCWVAPRDVVPGREYAQSIVEAIAGSRLTVLVFSAGANSSPHVRRELERTASHGIPILPFRVEDVVPAPSVEYFISDAHWLDAMTPPLEQHLEHLVGTVRLLLDRQTTMGEESDAARAGEPGPAPTPMRFEAAQPRKPSRSVLYAVLAGVLLLAIVAVALVVALGGSDPEQQVAPTSDPEVTTSVQTDGQTAGGSTSVTVEFDDGLGSGWTWENEEPQAWAVDAGALVIEVLQSPPIRNALLRDLPDGDSVIQTRIEFDPVAPGQAAGLALVGDDLGDRVELCWTTEGLHVRTYQAGAMVDGVDIAPDQFADGEWVGAELGFDIASGYYTARFQSEVTPDWQIHTAPVPDFVTRVGLITYATEEAAGETAAFTRFVQQQ